MDQIAKLRAERGWSLRELSRRSGVALETISHAERGHTKPHPRTVYKLAQAFGVPYEELLGKALAPTRSGPHEEERLYRGPEPARPESERTPEQLQRRFAFWKSWLGSELQDMNAEIEEVVNRMEITSRRRLAKTISYSAVGVLSVLDDQHVLKELAQVVMATVAGEEVSSDLRRSAWELHNAIVKVLHAGPRVNQAAVSGEVSADDIGEVVDLALERKLKDAGYPVDELGSLQRETG